MSNYTDHFPDVGSSRPSYRGAMVLGTEMAGFVALPHNMRQRPWLSSSQNELQFHGDADSDGIAEVDDAVSEVSWSPARASTFPVDELTEDGGMDTGMDVNSTCMGSGCMECTDPDGRTCSDTKTWHGATTHMALTWERTWEKHWENAMSSSYINEEQASKQSGEQTENEEELFTARDNEGEGSSFQMSRRSRSASYLLRLRTEERGVTDLRYYSPHSEPSRSSERSPSSRFSYSSNSSRSLPPAQLSASRKRIRRRSTALEHHGHIKIHHHQDTSYCPSSAIPPTNFPNSHPHSILHSPPPSPYNPTPSFHQAHPSSVESLTSPNSPTLSSPDAGRPPSNHSEPQQTTSSMVVPLIHHPMADSFLAPTASDITVADPDAIGDFHDFLGVWQGESGRGARGWPYVSLPHDGSPINTSVGSKRVYNSVKSSVISDQQGITWQDAMTTRDAARGARSIFYRHITPMGCVSTNRDHFKQDHAPFGFRSFQPISEESTRPKVLHFQLRNLLATTSLGNVYFASDHLVQRFNPSDGSVRTVLNTHSEPSTRHQHSIVSLAANQGLVVAGELQGGYAMKYLHSSLGSNPIRGTVTSPRESGSINHVEVSKDRISGNPIAVFSSNDQYIRILDCERNIFTHKSTYNGPVNCSATSPDGRMRAVVGDFNEIVFTEAVSGAPITRVTGVHSNAFAFACAWSPDGLHVATGGDDLRVVIRDVRMWTQTVGVVDSKLTYPRSLRFSPLGGGSRILAIAEQDDVLQLVDASTYDSEHVHVQDMFGAIAGFDFSEGGDKIYLANADRRYGGVFEYERTGCTSRCVDDTILHLIPTWDSERSKDVIRMRELAGICL
ncbi:WD40 repeat-like protein [Eremomyces bilateralis CBS 781.70]|uniref:WD40 repeat-like protein n=1 Tax=Eremomyces bilateralis CBS 781.70 TaxID=1392243 RepID=A0A6G1FT58_9PEZI|nr:WD40 repeat-like protein [Eremomyces bilateralis CBS 781.70]KAF1808977.1 WD40 repeat-like protein [Eremomyces bilateralis CBS 781.70]